ncbi:major facilitator superfamily domain-containing protein [Lactarius quietus]|nr:major facilitator superfamily domain-containing protein [Lactarius quietus]
MAAPRVSQASLSMESGGKGNEDHVIAVNTGLDDSQVDERKLVRKIDLHLIPWLSLLYLLSFLDRTSIGNAKLYGLEKSLHLTDKQYLLALTLLLPICLVRGDQLVPSNIFLKHLRPSLWLSGLMLLWGIMMTVQGLVHNYGGLLGLRWMLGMMEAGLWYKRCEYGIRTAIFFSAASVSGAFGGLLAAAISNMDGVGGKPGWAWIFILEGLATVVAGAASFFIIQDFPDTARFLSEAERAMVIRRLQDDDQFSAGGEKFKIRNIVNSLKDWKTWLGIGMYVGCAMPLYAFALFLPSIIHEYVGYKATPANLLTVPVYTFACIVTCLVGFAADRLQQRGIFNIALSCVGGLAYIVLIVSKTPALSYVAVYFAAGLAVPRFRCTMYRLGHGLVLLYIGIGIISSIAYYVFLRRENATRGRGERDEVIEGAEEREERARRNGRFASVEEAKREKGDRWSGYRYIL